MNVFINRSKGDCRYALLYSCVDLFRVGVARHRLHNFIKNLTLVGRRDPVIAAKFTEGTGLDVGRGPHEELVNDKFSYSSSVSCRLRFSDQIGEKQVSRSPRKVTGAEAIQQPLGRFNVHIALLAQAECGKSGIIGIRKLTDTLLFEEANQALPFLLFYDSKVHVVVGYIRVRIG